MLRKPKTKTRCTCPDPPCPVHEEKGIAHHVELFGGEVLARHRLAGGDGEGWVDLVSYTPMTGRRRWAIEQWLSTPSIGGGEPLCISCVTVDDTEIQDVRDYLDRVFRLNPDGRITPA